MQSYIMAVAVVVVQVDVAVYKKSTENAILHNGSGSDNGPPAEA